MRGIGFIFATKILRQNMWIVIIIVCVIFGFISQPVDRIVKNRVPSKWLAIILQFVINWIILMILYGIAALIGFSIWE